MLPAPARNASAAHRCRRCMHTRCCCMQRAPPLHAAHTHTHTPLPPQHPHCNAHTWGSDKPALARRAAGCICRARQHAAARGELHAALCVHGDGAAGNHGAGASCRPQHERGATLCAQSEREGVEGVTSVQHAWGGHFLSRAHAGDCIRASQNKHADDDTARRLTRRGSKTRTAASWRARRSTSRR